jgi:uncharacterized protein
MQFGQAALAESARWSGRGIVSDHEVVVRGIYEAFGRGDIPAILGRLAEDVAWEYWESTAHDAGVPWLVSRRGRAGAEAFFQSVGSWTFQEFTVRDILASEQRVAVMVVVEATLPSGKRFRDEELHLWTFDDEGKISEFRHFVDTAKHIALASD